MRGRRIKPDANGKSWFYGRELTCDKRVEEPMSWQRRFRGSPALTACRRHNPTRTAGIGAVVRQPISASHGLREFCRRQRP
jgi:hypothetical protein